MLVHPWDSAIDADEWRAFLAAQGFGHFVAPGLDREIPVVVPTQYAVSGDVVLIHLARPNPVWKPLAERPIALLSVAGDWTYIPSTWNADAGDDPSRGLPTTYYGAVQITGRVEIVSDPEEKAALLREQLGDFQPEGGHLDPTEHPRMLAGMQGMRLHIDEVKAKFKYGGNKPAEKRIEIADRLSDRDSHGDSEARGHLLRRTRREEAS